MKKELYGALHPGCTTHVPALRPLCGRDQNKSKEGTGTCACSQASDRHGCVPTCPLAQPVQAIYQHQSDVPPCAEQRHSREANAHTAPKAGQGRQQLPCAPDTHTGLVRREAAWVVVGELADAVGLAKTEPVSRTPAADADTP